MIESPSALPITVVVLTFNEERNLAACLASVATWVTAIFVVDSGSTDRTLQVAQGFGATVTHHPFETHARQWSWALETLPIPTEWVLGLDADQRITFALRDEISHIFGSEKLCEVKRSRATEAQTLEGVAGFYISRRQMFRGKWIKHGGYYPKYLLKLFRIGNVHLDLNDRMDHHFYIRGRVAKLRNDLIEENQNETDISFWVEKHLRYASLVACEEFRATSNKSSQPVKSAFFGNPDQKTLWLKRLWRGFPLYARPFFYFFYRYFFRFGILDGKEGLIFHFLQGLWFRLLVDIKIDELRRERSPTARPEGGAVKDPEGSWPTLEKLAVRKKT